MFARTLTMQLKPNTAAEFTKALENHVIPALRKQKGFRDELVFVGPNAIEAFAISLWDTKENAETYRRESYPDIAKTLANVVEGTPQLRTYDVLSSTLHGKAAGVSA
jgi:heme-degrading monooxygenase HmoA